MEGSRKQRNMGQFGNIDLKSPINPLDFSHMESATPRLLSSGTDGKQGLKSLYDPNMMRALNIATAAPNMNKRNARRHNISEQHHDFTESILSTHNNSVLKPSLF